MTVAKKEPRPTKAEKIVGVLSSLNEINQELPPTNQNGKGEKRISKKCFGCGDNFTHSPSENYDYCQNCEINRERHILKENRCSECGDGSGLIKFPNQPPRSCKLCYLVNQEVKGRNWMPFLPKNHA